MIAPAVWHILNNPSIVVFLNNTLLAPHQQRDNQRGSSLRNPTTHQSYLLRQSRRQPTCLSPGLVLPELISPIFLHKSADAS